MKHNEFQLIHNNIVYNIATNWEEKQVFINGIECINKEYDLNSKSIYVVIPNENEPLIAIIQKRKCYIVPYNSNETLLNNGGDHIFIRLSKIQKLVVLIFMVAPVAAIAALYGKGSNSYLYVLSIGAFYCLSTVLYTTILKTPRIVQKYKRIWFMILHCVISIITFLVSLYCLYGLDF